MMKTSRSFHSGTQQWRPIKQKTYVRLVDEGTEVSRPTEALDLGNGLLELLSTPEYDSEDEAWEFRPGSIVRCERSHGCSGEYLLAVKA
jgi:hypothetical protein